MSNLWNQLGIPHRGWSLDDVIDVREDGQSQWETDYETCMMCGKEQIRFIHIVSHPEMKDDFRVGCQCAQKMTDDYVNPELREKELRNRASRRNTWMRRQWRTSKNGNHFLNIQEHHVLIYIDKNSNKYKVKIDDTFGRKRFDTIQKAKAAAFNGIEYLKENREW